ncbi:MAG TPA: glycoside hydrolase family 3 N-terminal domain-containing protein [Candidatus Sulfotelmatobacter sp.]|nr:glycoside hydrolase family 3 N-terminal domain-containing protein [Candidatus Sulfotelmatobacter sp.]
MHTIVRSGIFNSLAVSLALGIWLFLACAAWADENPPRSARDFTTQPAQTFLKDTTISQKVDALLAQMTLDEKIGQMALFTSSGATTGPSGARQDLEDQIRKGNCGGVFNAHTVAKIRHFQKIAVEDTRLKIPLIFGYDVIHGYKTIFPIPLAEASSWDTNAIEKSERVAAIEASAGGLNWTFAPMVDIARDPRWGRIAEGAGEDPFLGSEIAGARVRGFQGNDLGDGSSIVACVKHFAAYGAVQGGRDYNTVDMSERTLREVYLPPYKAAIDAGALSVMSSFNDLNGIPASANSFLLKQILRDEWGFKGFVVTDYLAINELVQHGIAMDECDAGCQALNAGVDMDMQGGIYLKYIKTLLADGKISQNQVDESVKRILTIKFMLGLFDDPYRCCDDKRETNLIFTADNLKAAYDMACESMVLLKNKSQTLPLKPGLKIAVIGPLAKAQRDLLGCWAGRGDSNKVETVFDWMVNDNMGGQTSFAKGCDVSSSDRSQFAKAVKAASHANLVVMVLGESATMTGEASSRTSINLPGVQTDLIREVKKTGKPIVIVLINGRPLALEEESSLANAVLEAWAPGTKGGEAIADVLFGKYNPSAKLPVTFPRNLGQVPIFYSTKKTGRPFDPASPMAKYKSAYLDSPNDPLYPFGFGLSYTAFNYSGLQLDKKALTPGGQITAMVDVSNTGKYDGVEIVQLYTRQLVGSVTRPVLELKGFQRVYLKAGESRRVAFTLGGKDLTFLRRDMTWGTEPGKFEVFVGPNSRDLQSAQFDLVKDR